MLRILLILFVGATASGLVAYLGNKLGRQVGRRKMTIFGLRPKYTSNLITVFTGSMIFLVTLGLAAAASEDVRTFIEGLDSLRAEQAQLQQQKKELLDNLAELTHKIVAGQIVAPGDPLAVGPVECGRSEDEIREQIDLLLTLANDNVLAKNNEAGKKLDVPELTPDKHLVGYLKAQKQQIIVELAREKGTRLCLIRNGTRPIFLGEWLTAEISVAANPLIFKKGQVITSKRIDGSESQDKVLTSLTDFIMRDLQYVALEAHMMRNPLSGKLVTSIDRVAIPREAERIAQSRRPVKVQVVANTDIYPLGPLDVRLVVLNQ